MRAAFAAVLLAAGLALAAPAGAAQPVPMNEIIEKVRDLAAAQVGRKPGDINTIQSLFAQGFSERDFMELVGTVQMEFNIVIPDNEIQQGKWDDAVRGFSVRRLAELVARQMHDPL